MFKKQQTAQKMQPSESALIACIDDVANFILDDMHNMSMASKFTRHLIKVCPDCADPSHCVRKFPLEKGVFSGKVRCSSLGSDRVQQNLGVLLTLCVPPRHRTRQMQFVLTALCKYMNSAQLKTPRASLEDSLVLQDLRQQDFIVLFGVLCNTSQNIGELLDDHFELSLNAGDTQANDTCINALCTAFCERPDHTDVTTFTLKVTTGNLTCAAFPQCLIDPIEAGSFHADWFNNGRITVDVQQAATLVVCWREMMTKVFSSNMRVRYASVPMATAVTFKGSIDEETLFFIKTVLPAISSALKEGATDSMCYRLGKPSDMVKSILSPKSWSSMPEGCSFVFDTFDNLNNGLTLWILGSPISAATQSKKFQSLLRTLLNEEDDMAVRDRLDIAGYLTGEDSELVFANSIRIDCFREEFCLFPEMVVYTCNEERTEGTWTVGSNGMCTHNDIEGHVVHTSVDLRGYKRESWVYSTSL